MSISGPSVLDNPVPVINDQPHTVSRNFLDDIDFNASDFLQLSASQELCLNQAISTMQDVQPAKSSPSVSSRLMSNSPSQSLGVFKRTDNHSELSYRAPVYCFNNCTVTINHKWATVIENILCFESWNKNLYQ